MLIWRLSYRVAKLLHRSGETIYRVYRYLNCGNTITQYYEQYYKVNKSHNGRQPATLPSNQVKYLKLESSETDWSLGITKLISIILNI